MTLDETERVGTERLGPFAAVRSRAPMPTLASGSVDDGDDLDLSAYLRALGRRWKAVALVAVLAVAVSLGLSFQQDSRYRAESELLIRPRDSTAVIAGTPGVNATEAARALNNEVEVFESGVVRGAVASRYGGPLDPDDVEATVSSDSSDVIEASLVATDPAEAAALVNLYVEVFVEGRREQRTDELLAVGSEIQAAIDALTAQLEEAREPLDELDEQVAASPDDAALASRRDRLAAELSEPLAQLESRRAFYESQIEDLELSAGIAQGGGAEVLTEAKPPESPVSPQPLRDAAIALVVGLVLGVGIALMVDTLDERIRSVADLEQVTGGLPTLALLPEVARGRDNRFVGTRDDPRGMQAEAFRSLRTAVKFAALDRSVKVLQVTSCSQGEGKTTVVANLAVALAQGGDRVAVVCCDLRRPHVHERFEVPLAPGLTDVLLGDATLPDALRRYDTNVLILPAGTSPPNPSELLSSTKTAAVIQAVAEGFDVVLIDSTPVLPVTDALVVSRLADATLLVVDSRSTPRKAVRRTLQLLDQVDAPVIGVILNGLPDTGRYGYAYESEHASRGSR